MNVHLMQIVFTCLTALQRLDFAKRTKTAIFCTYKLDIKETLNLKSKWENLRFHAIVRRCGSAHHRIGDATTVAHKCIATYTYTSLDEKKMYAIDENLL